MADRSAASSDLLPSFSRPQVFGELMLPDDAVVGLVRMADPILRLIGSMGEEGDDRVPSRPGPGGPVLGITDVLAGGIAMLIHQTSSFVVGECWPWCRTISQKSFAWRSYDPFVPRA